MVPGTSPAVLRQNLRLHASAVTARQKPMVWLSPTSTALAAAMDGVGPTTNSSGVTLFTAASVVYESITLMSRSKRVVIIRALLDAWMKLVHASAAQCRVL